MKRKLISSLLCLCMLISLIPVAAFAGDEDGTGTTATPAIASFGYAENDTDANKEISDALNSARKTSDVSVTDCDKQTMWVVFSGLTDSKQYKFTLTHKSGNTSTEIKLDQGTSSDAEPATTTSTKEGPGEVFTMPSGKSGVIGIYWTFNKEANPVAGTKVDKEIAAGDYTVELYEVTAASGSGSPTETKVSINNNTLGIGSITIKEGKGSSEEGVTTYYEKDTKVSLPAAPTAPAGKAFDGWMKTGSEEKLAVGTQVTVGNTADTYTAQWKDASTDILQAGFSWKAADANKGLTDAIANIGKNKTITDSIDQTAWLLVQRPAASEGEKAAATDLYYWYVVEDSKGAALFEGPVTIEAQYTARFVYFSFLHFEQNDKGAVAPADGKMTVKLYSLASNPVTGEGDTATVTKPDADTLKNPVATKPIDAGANPAKITVTPTVSGKTVKVDFNQVMSGRYYIELVKEGETDPVASFNSDCNWLNTTDPGTFETYTFSGVDFTAGKYTVNLYPRAVGKVDAEGKLGTTPIASKDFTLDGTINSVDVYVGSNETPSTAITAKLNAAKTGIEVSGSLVNKETSMKIKLVAHTAAGDVEVNEIVITDESGNLKTTTDKKLTVLGTEYPITLALTAVETTVVDAATSADVSAIPKTEQGNVKTALEDAGTKTTTDLTDAATAAAVAVDTAKKDASYTKNALEDLQKVDTNAKAEDLEIVVQPYIDIKAESYDKEAGKMKLEINGMTRVVATTTANKSSIELSGEDANAVEIGKPQAMPVSTSIDLQIVLPTGFVTDETQAYVLHKNAHLHKGTITTTTASTLAFTSDDGLSPFVIDLKADPAAKIGETYYNTFIEAVNAVKDDETITILKNGTYEATVNSTVKFKVVKDAGATSATVTLKDADGNVVTPDKDGFYSFTAKKNEGGSSGGGGVSSNVTIDRPTNGKVSVTPTAPSKGATVTINLTPDTGYAVGTVTVTDKDGNAVELTKVSDTQYTFTMPDGKVTVKATFTKVDTPPATGFTDVAADAYYADAVKWAVDKGITNGLTATTFGPNNSCTRGQMVTFLWRAAGSPAAAGTNSFSDVASGEYYYNAVLWAVEKGITNGTSATTFSPNATVNRGQTVTFLYRYAESPAATGDTSFTDVAADAYYADAVKWAVAEEITNGTSSTTFSPASNCTRGQIVTFLYRQMAE